MLSAEQASEAVFIQNIKVPILRHVVLEQSEAVGVDSPDKHGTEPIQKVVSFDLGDPLTDSGLESLCCPLGERESHDLGWLDSLFDQSGDPA
jgi:hypothetical protein